MTARTDAQREADRIRQRRHRAIARAARVAALVRDPSSVESPARPDGWEPDPVEPWWTRPEAEPLRRAWYGRGLRLPMTGAQCRLVARWARRGAPFRALVRVVATLRARGTTYRLVGAAIAAAVVSRARRDADQLALGLALDAPRPVAPADVRRIPARPEAPPGDGRRAWLQLGIAWGIR